MIKLSDGDEVVAVTLLETILAWDDSVTTADFVVFTKYGNVISYTLDRSRGIAKQLCIT